MGGELRCRRPKTAEVVGGVDQRGVKVGRVRVQTAEGRQSRVGGHGGGGMEIGQLGWWRSTGAWRFVRLIWQRSVGSVGGEGRRLRMTYAKVKLSLLINK